MSKLTTPGELQAITSKVAEIDEDSNADELWTGLKIPIASTFLEKLGKNKWNRKDWTSTKTLSH